MLGLSTEMREKSTISYAALRWGVAFLGILGIVLWLFPGDLWHFKSKQEPVSAEEENWWSDLDAIFGAAVKNFKGDAGIYFKDLKRNRIIEYNADHTFISASLIKLPILASSINAVESGKISLNRTMKLKPQNVRHGSGHFQRAVLGSEYSFSNILYTMISDSDNTATAMVIDTLGYNFLNSCFARFGLKVTRIRDEGMNLADVLDPALDNYTSPRDMGIMLEKIYRHEIATDGMSELMIQILKGANTRGRLGRDLPAGWDFARKTGLLRWNCHDVGIVYAPSGDYILCVLTGRNRDILAARDFIADVGKNVYPVIAARPVSKSLFHSFRTLAQNQTSRPTLDRPDSRAGADNSDQSE